MSDILLFAAGMTLGILFKDKILSLVNNLRNKS